MEDCKVDLKKILVALDLSAYSETTFTHALELARALKGELIILNVINSRGLDSLDIVEAEGFDISKEKYLKNVREERQAELEGEYLSKTGDVPARLVFRVGLPYEQILKAVESEGADLLVMHAKGKTALEGVLFGTAAEKVFRRATCPVVSVRGPEHCRMPG